MFADDHGHHRFDVSCLGQIGSESRLLGEDPVQVVMAFRHNVQRLGSARKSGFRVFRL